MTAEASIGALPADASPGGEGGAEGGGSSLAAGEALRCGSSPVFCSFAAGVPAAATSPPAGESACRLAPAPGAPTAARAAR
eukprot:scaffold20577_cov62-Isochrysis_galbana.AAC.2